MRTEIEKIFYNSKTYTGMLGLAILPFLLMLTSIAGFDRVIDDQVDSMYPILMVGNSLSIR